MGITPPSLSPFFIKTNRKDKKMCETTNTNITHDDIINQEIEQEHAEKDIRDEIINEALNLLDL